MPTYFRATRPGWELVWKVDGEKVFIRLEGGKWYSSNMVTKEDLLLRVTNGFVVEISKEEAEKTIL